MRKSKIKLSLWINTILLIAEYFYMFWAMIQKLFFTMSNETLIIDLVIYELSIITLCVEEYFIRKI